MREFAIEKVNRIVTKKVTCDDCGRDCTNTNAEILLKHSFSDKSEHYKDVCWKCYDDNYKEKVQKNKFTDENEQLKHMMS